MLSGAGVGIAGEGQPQLSRRGGALRPLVAVSKRHASERWHLVVQALRCDDMRGGWTYIMASKPRGMLYVGVTAQLAARVDQHRRDVGSAFCRRYGIRTLVLAEPHDDIVGAIAREKALKAWKRDWKIELIETNNPDWCDLYDRIS